jgi:hypothetical protein
MSHDTPDTAFIIALGKQQNFVRVAVVEAGISAKNAARTAGNFETGAKLEWDRMAPLLQQDAMGRA